MMFTNVNMRHIDVVKEVADAVYYGNLKEHRNQEQNITTIKFISVDICSTILKLKDKFCTNLIFSAATPPLDPGEVMVGHLQSTRICDVII